MNPRLFFCLFSAFAIFSVAPFDGTGVFAQESAAADSAVAVSKPAVALKAAEVFGDFMVLQRDIAVPVWGTAEAGTEVSVEFAGQKKTARADAAGQWRLSLAPLAASAENRELTVRGGDAVLVFKNVVVGEVWVCSGQSNMEQGIVFKNTHNGAAEADGADFPAIRLKFSKKVMGAAPQTNWQGSGWQACSPQTIRQGTWDGFSAAAFFFGRNLHKELQVPIGLIQSAWGGTRVEPWTTPAGFAGVAPVKNLADYRPNPAKLEPHNPTVLYNAMIHPLVPYAIRGAIWYQGEANLGETDYAAKKRALIEGWRGAWKQGDFPFYFVQLAPFRYGRAYDRGGPYSLPVTWEQQTQFAAEVPLVGMAIINDAADLRDIHPGDKQTVGARLARLALSRTYGKAALFNDDSGPIFKTARVISAQTIEVEFNHVNSGLKTRDGAAPTHFELAGKDGVFHPATAKISGKKVEVSCGELENVTQVRFAWHELAEPNLTNGDGLPAGPFRWGK